VLLSRHTCARQVAAIGDPDERFELLLDLFVDGLAQRARE
jgi:hypothetical protein